MFTTAAFSCVVVAAVFYGASENWRRADTKMVIALVALGAFLSLLAAGAIYRLATNNDPINLIRQPIPCSSSPNIC